MNPTEQSTPAAQERHVLPHDVLARMIRAGYGKFGSYSGMQVVWDASPGPDLLEALWRIANATPDNTNSQSAESMASWAYAVAATAIAKATGADQ